MRTTRFERCSGREFSQFFLHKFRQRDGSKAKAKQEELHSCSPLLPPLPLSVSAARLFWNAAFFRRSLTSSLPSAALSLFSDPA